MGTRHGLKAEDFHIFDNKQPQELRSFEEHDTKSLTPVVETKAQPGVYSNAYLQHMPPVSNVLLLDVANLQLQDQMYLSYELTRFLKTFPADQKLAVMLWTGGQCILLQDFTADRGLLEAAFRRGLPRFRSPDWQYTNDVTALHQVALYTAPIPGRKNVIWFSGGSSLVLRPDPTNLPDMRPVYDELEADRISIYPVDARGLTVSGGVRQGVQHTIMEDVAQATGGKAYYNNNGLDAITSRVVDADRSFYTLTYTPKEFKYDDKWHKVSVEVDGAPYTLSYRRGYYADAYGAGSRAADNGARDRLLADGSRLKTAGETDAPIVFQAHVSPAPASGPEVKASDPVSTKKDHQRLLVDYMVPASSLVIRQVNGHAQTEMIAAALEINEYGRRVGGRVDRFTMGINEAKLSQSPDGYVKLQQEIDAGKGDGFLMLLVVDPVTHRYGRLEVPLQVPMPAQAAQVQIPVRSPATQTP
jgi:VWFA-related protein